MRRIPVIAAVLVIAGFAAGAAFSVNAVDSVVAKRQDSMKESRKKCGMFPVVRARERR
ncbi:hypothetical protein MAXJ12_34139 [Mesorhizobium alhagi CCNWXJ12-2]|uniref:Uncharacterized protein n=1 Tax=Mesorhizobium alhagi CCNWXJ12-2 TaxID=1107882 RepID=H0I2X0_9HYPH|nr:hypothetical protein MAXJ12_34139 [Mesorhizobium alhagi CCNWXJ12-2]